MTANIPILILAAGTSTRMRGRDKLLEVVANGRTLLADRIWAAEATGHPVLVALPEAGKRWNCIKNSQATGIVIANPQDGLSASLVGALKAASETADGVLILPADMPDILTSDMQKVLTAFDGTNVVRGCSDGKPGHPVLFPKAWFNRLKALKGDNGARELLRADPDQILVPLPGRHALCDLDTPEDWAKWRAGVKLR